MLFCRRRRAGCLWSAAAARRLSISGGGGGVIEHAAAAAAFSGVNGEKFGGTGASIPMGQGTCPPIFMKGARRPW